MGCTEGIDTPLETYDEWRARILNDSGTMKMWMEVDGWLFPTQANRSWKLGEAMHHLCPASKEHGLVGSTTSRKHMCWCGAEPPEAIRMISLLIGSRL